MIKRLLGPVEIVAYVGAIVGCVAFGLALAALSLALVVMTRG